MIKAAMLRCNLAARPLQDYDALRSYPFLHQKTVFIDSQATRFRVACIPWRLCHAITLSCPDLCRIPLTCSADFFCAVCQRIRANFLWQREQ
jgi:hypothetical protein